MVLAPSNDPVPCAPTSEALTVEAPQTSLMVPLYEPLNATFLTLTTWAVAACDVPLGLALVAPVATPDPNTDTAPTVPIAKNFLNVLMNPTYKGSEKYH